MARRAPRPLDPPRIDLNGKDVRFRTTDGDFERAERMNEVEVCRLSHQPITKLPSGFGGALRELALENCAELASLAGIERLGGLTSLSLKGFDAAWIGRELARAAELPDLARVSLDHVRGGAVEVAPVVALPALIELAIENSAVEGGYVRVGESPTLRRLRLGWRGAWTIADDLAPLVELRSLELGGGVHVTGAIGALVNLERFVIDCDTRRLMLRVLPAEIGSCRALVELSIRGPVARLPEQIGGCTRLEVLELRDTVIRALPEGIGGLTKLRRLDASGTEITGLPNAIGALVALRELVLPPTAIEAAPGTVERLALETFVGDAALGARIPRLPPPTPEADDVTLADPDRIPEAFGDPLRLVLDLPAWRGRLPQLAALRRLRAIEIAVGGDADDVGTVLAELAHLPYLETVALTLAPDVTRVPDAIAKLARLTRLRIAGDGVRAIDLAACPALTELVVRCPMLARIDALPAGLAALELVEAGFGELPAAVVGAPALAALSIATWRKPLRLEAIAEMRALRKLAFDGLTDFDAVVAAMIAAASGVDEIDFGRSAMTSLPAAIGALPALRVLGLRRTRVRRLPPSIAACHTLEKVELPRPEFAGDPREQLPPGAWSMRSWVDQVRCERYRSRNRT